MKTSQNGIDLIKSFEGCRLTSYKCLPSEKYYTIGYGHYGSDVKLGMKITQAQAEEYLKKDLEKFENNVNKFSKYNWTQNEFDALVSFAYNIGSIDQLTANGTRSKSVIADKMLLYVNSGGVKYQGLVNRRKKERDLFLKGSNTVTPSPAPIKTSIEIPKPTLRNRCKGEEVKKLQKALNHIYKLNLVVDGIYGKNTAEGVRVLQCEGKLIVDAIYGPKSEAYLRKKV